jgi:hypothetical protein
MNSGRTGGRQAANERGQTRRQRDALEIVAGSLRGVSRVGRIAVLECGGLMSERLRIAACYLLQTR